MSLSLITNLASLNAQRNVTAAQEKVSGSVERLSSGFRINDASVDPAGLAISSKLQATIRGLYQAQRNGNDAISMLQTADSALGQINNILARMTELATQGANGGTLGTSDRANINTEFTSLLGEIDRISSGTQYNGVFLIDGSLSAGTTFQVGVNNTTNDQISLSLSSSGSSQLGLHGQTITTQGTSKSVLGLVQTAIATLAGIRASVGATESRLNFASSNLYTTVNSLSAANSRISDTDVAAETADLARTQILLQAGVSVLAQANQEPAFALNLLRS